MKDTVPGVKVAKFGDFPAISATTTNKATFAPRAYLAAAPVSTINSLFPLAIQAATLLNRASARYMSCL